MHVQATAGVFELIGPVFLSFAVGLQQQVSIYNMAERKLTVRQLLDVAEVCDLAAAAPT